MYYNHIKHKTMKLLFKTKQILYFFSPDDKEVEDFAQL